MALVLGYQSFQVTTTVATQIKTAGANYVCAQLAAAGAAVTLTVHNGLVTSAATQVFKLEAAINSTDRLELPIRCPDGVKVKLSANTGIASIFVA